MVLFSVDLLVQLGLCQGSVLNTEVSLYLALALVSELLLGFKKENRFLGSSSGVKNAKSMLRRL